MPVFVRDYDNDEATIIMVDSNLQREEIFQKYMEERRIEANNHTVEVATTV